MLTFISEKLFSTLLDLFVSEVLKEVRSEMDPKIEQIQQKLNILESRVDKIQLLHFHSALSSFRDGKLDDALKEFAYAERADDFGAVARFWLSMMLQEQGKTEEAVAKFKEALTLNPFVVPLEFIENKQVRDLSLQTFANPKPIKWSKRFVQDGTVLASVPAQESWVRWIWRGVERVVTNESAQLLIGAVSTSGKDPIVQWDVAYGNIPERFTLFTQLNMESGTVQRTKRFRDVQLLFATSRHYVLESTGKPPRFDFISMGGGKKVNEMSRTYFETAFFPDYSRRKKIPGYVASNQVMSDSKPEKVDIDSYDTRYTKSLSDPFGTKAFKINVYNYTGSRRWATLHATGVHPTGEARLQRLE